MSWRLRPAWTGWPRCSGRVPSRSSDPGRGMWPRRDGHRLPGTVYGISKNAGEQWCNWYHRHRGVDVRSVRYPGLIGTHAPPGGGTTDYAVEVFDHLNDAEPYTCFLAEDTQLPMMHMDDAVLAITQLMSVPRSALRCTEAYNIQAMSFDPATLFAEIRRHVPNFRYRCAPDFRQDIAAGVAGCIGGQYGPGRLGLETHRGPARAGDLDDCRAQRAAATFAADLIFFRLNLPSPKPSGSRWRIRSVPYRTHR